MLLDELVAAIENVKSRIEHHQNSLRQSEALTRYSLIDPMLRALGWDTTDPALVTPEYEVGGKRADYALLEGNQVVVFLEAKRLDENLSTHRSQVAAYASELGIKYPALTNGNKWEVYDNSKLVPIDQRQILNVSINESPSSRIALQLLLLWQPNLASGEPVSANEPIFSAQQTGPNPQPTIIQDPAAVTPPSPGNEGWTSLETFLPKSGEKFPSAVRLPDGTISSIHFQRDLLIEVAEFLVKCGKLTATACPIESGPRRYLVNVEGKHKNAQPFNNDHQLTNGLFLETSFPAPQTAKSCRDLLKRFSEDPAKVHLKLS